MIDGNKKKDIEAIVQAMRRIHRTVTMDAFQTSRRFGLTGSQGAVLRLLATRGSLSSAEVSRRLRVTPSNVTGLVDRLEKKGLVRRSPSLKDRRVVRIVLTEKGRKLEDRLPDTIQQKLDRDLGRMSAPEVRRILDSLRELVDAIRSPDEESSG